VCGLSDQHSLPVSTNTRTPDLPQQKAQMPVEGGQEKGGRGRRTAGSKGRTCRIAIGGDFRNMRWGGVGRDSGKGGKTISILLGEGEEMGHWVCGGDLQLL